MKSGINIVKRCEEEKPVDRPQVKRNMKQEARDRSIKFPFENVFNNFSQKRKKGEGFHRKKGITLVRCSLPWHIRYALLMVILMGKNSRKEGWEILWRSWKNISQFKKTFVVLFSDFSVLSVNER
jgi:hypothetical protein